MFHNFFLVALALAWSVGYPEKSRNHIFQNPGIGIYPEIPLEPALPDAK